MSILEDNLKDIKYEKYIFIQSNKRFIYRDPTENEIVGVNSLLANKHVEIKDTIYKKNKELVKISIDNIIIGWTEVNMNELIRLYRLPVLYGIIELENSQYEFIDKYEKELEYLKSKIIKLRYVFLYNKIQYFMVGTLTGDILIPINPIHVLLLNKPNNELFIFLESGHKLFKHSNLLVSAGTINKSMEYQVTRYFNDSNILRVRTKDGEFWTTKKHNFANSIFEIPNVNSLEKMDYIVFLSKDRYILSKQVNTLQKKFDFIRNNLVINTENDKLIFEKFIGEKDDY